MPHRILSTPEDVASFVTFLQGLPLPITVEWQKGRDRSLDQNRLMWLWASEVSQQRGDETPAEIQRRWKLHHGVPILRADSQSFRDVYDRCIKGLPYEMKLKAIELIEVTSVLKVRQMVAFLDAVQRECLEQGLQITDPDPMLSDYQARYRAKPEAA